LIETIGKKFKRLHLFKSSYIFREGDKAKIFLIQRGEFRVTKKLVYTDGVINTSYTANEEVNHDMTPQRLNEQKKHMQRETQAKKIESIELALIGSHRAIGEEEALSMGYHQTSAQCTS